MKTITDFFHMHGYGQYIWSAYACAFVLMTWQWLAPWRRWRGYVKQQAKDSHE